MPIRISANCKGRPPPFHRKGRSAGEQRVPEHPARLWQGEQCVPERPAELWLGEQCVPERSAGLWLGEQCVPKRPARLWLGEQCVPKRPARLWLGEQCVAEDSEEVFWMKSEAVTEPWACKAPVTARRMGRKWRSFMAGGKSRISIRELAALADSYGIRKMRG